MFCKLVFLKIIFIDDNKLFGILFVKFEEL